MNTAAFDDACPGQPALDVLTIGESMVLLVADEPGPLCQVSHFSKRLAGADSNVAIGLARLGFKVGWLSRLGADSFGDHVRSAIGSEGVDISQVITDRELLTGMMLKSRAVGGADPVTEYHRRGSAASALSSADLKRGYMLAARHYHATGISPALSPEVHALVQGTMRDMRAAGRTVSFDPNLRPALWPSEAVMRTRLLELAQHADWVLPGIDEGRLLTGHTEPHDMAGYFLERGAQAVVVKLGAKGAYYRTVGEQGVVPAAPVAEVVDTVGAGDGFAVGLLSARLEGRTWRDAVARGNWIAAQAIQVIGDMEGLPRRDALPRGL